MWPIPSDIHDIMMKQFSRDPCALLKPRSSSSLNDDSWTRRGRAQEIQPITYKHMALKVMNPNDDDEWTPCYYYETRINWHTGEIACFNDLDDALNHTPIMQTNYKVLVQPPPRTCEEYVKEVFAFLQRGHSMLHPECQCHLAMSEERIKELGLTSRRSAVAVQCCLVERKKERKTFEEIALELNVESLHGLIVDAVGGQEKKRSLLNVLIQLAGMVATQNCSSSESKRHYLHSPLCCIPPFIETVDDIVQAARIMHPFPYVITEEKVVIWLDFLKRDTRVLLLPIIISSSLPNLCNVFWNNPPTIGGEVDNDIRQLWIQHAPTTREEQNMMRRAQGMNSLLIREGLKPMETRPVYHSPPPKPEQPKRKKRKS